MVRRIVVVTSNDILVEPVCFIKFVLHINSRTSLCNKAYNGILTKRKCMSVLQAFKLIKLICKKNEFTLLVYYNVIDQSLCL